jgi:4-amino-4-deoxy-L-arabinose transferase-like glycosyltransferase
LSGPKTLFGIETSRVVSWLILLATASFLLTLRAESMGEESVYALMSYEMHMGGKWLTPVMYGQPYWRPPLFNWLITALSDGIGWSHMLLAARLVTLLATLGTAALAYWIARLHDMPRADARLAALIFLSFTYTLFWYGWISYSDALFGLFVVLAIAAGLSALATRRHAWLALVVLALAGGFLTKALTVYVFYGLAMLVAVTRGRHWRFALRWPSLAWHALALLLPLLWFTLLGRHNPQQGGMIGDIMHRALREQGARSYLLGVAGFAVDLFKMLLPMSAVLAAAAVLDIRGRRRWPALLDDPSATLLGMVALNTLPYLLAPTHNVRYVYPLSALLAVLMARIAARSEALRRGAIVGAGLFIALKVAMSAWWFPMYQHRWRDFGHVARDILRQTHGRALYIDDVTFAGVAVAARIVELHPGRVPLQAPRGGDKGYLIAYGPQPGWPTLVHRYRFGNTPLVLLCNLASCAAPATQRP